MNASDITVRDALPGKSGETFNVPPKKFAFIPDVPHKDASSNNVDDNPCMYRYPAPVEGDYAMMFDQLVTPGLARGQGIKASDGRVTGLTKWEDTKDAFYNYTYFPVVYSNGADTRCAMFMACYSSQKPTETVVGHHSVWSEYKLQNGVCNVDISTIADNNATLSLISAIEMTRPVPKSYIWLCRAFAYNAGYDTTIQVNVRDPPRIAGASFGLALAACILGSAPVAYTGFVKKMPSGYFDNNYDNTGNSSGFALIKRDYSYDETVPLDNHGKRPRIVDIGGIPAMHVNDIVEDVQMLPVKIAFCAANAFPLVIPHKSTYNQNLQKLLVNLAKSKTPYAQYLQAVSGDIARMYSTVEVDQGIPFASAGTNVLLATTLGNAVQLGAISFIQWSFVGVRSDELRSIFTGAQQFANQLGSQRMRQREVSAMQRQMLLSGDLTQYDAAQARQMALAQRNLEKKAEKAQEVINKTKDRQVARKTEVIKKSKVKMSHAALHPMSDKKKAGLLKARAKREGREKLGAMVRRNYSLDKSNPKRKLANIRKNNPLQSRYTAGRDETRGRNAAATRPPTLYQHRQAMEQAGQLLPVSVPHPLPHVNRWEETPQNTPRPDADAAESFAKRTRLGGGGAAFPEGADV